MLVKIVDYPEIGRVSYKRYKRTRKINIRISPFKGVQVSMPQRGSFVLAEAFVLSKKEWIKEHLANMQSIETQQKVGEHTVLKTLFSKIEFREHFALDKLEVEKKEGNYIIFFPQKSTLNINSEQGQELLKLTVEKILRQEAKNYIVNRVEYWKQKHQLKAGHTRIKKSRSCWGSCSSKNNLNFSLYLMLLPVELIDYVICHELAHLKVKNHSAQFWKHLETLYPESRAWDKKLKGYRMPFH